MKESNDNLNNGYISLSEATDYCDYSQEYLSLRARQGKLKAKKFGRNWVTKKEWLKQYITKTEEYNNLVKENQAKKIKTVSVKKPEVEKNKKIRLVSIKKDEGLPIESSSFSFRPILA
ncbi:hypothetical protein KAR26_02640, partial [Candidatus Parcubacteria bacterium]|nr:hypothetical protein [Candidatus Parcubacteria bacterium]